MASTGKYGRLELFCFEKGANSVVSTVENFEKFVKANGRQFAFSFQLGDITCRIGALCCLGDGVQSNICIFTTDVDISAEMLQKALKTVVCEYFYMLDGWSDTPNDCMCALASGKANNWKITENGSDYKKFSYALSMVAKQICQSLITEKGNGFVCTVIGAKSKNSAREIAKTVVKSPQIKNKLVQKRAPTQNVVSAIVGSNETVNIEKLNVLFRLADLEIVTFEENKETQLGKTVENRLFAGKMLQIIVDLKEGNYTATAYGNYADYIRA